MDRIVKFAIEQGYKGADYLGKWNGYECYEPYMSEDEVSAVGLPLFIMSKGGLIRMSTPEEAMQQIQESST